MPKLFRAILTFFLVSGSTTVLANEDLCPAPRQSPQDTRHLPHPSADTYHEAMKAAVLQATTSLDWVDDPASGNACGGYYLAPENPNPQQYLDPDEADLYMSADRVEQREDGFTHLEGDVELYQGKRRLRCDSMRYSEELEYSEVSGTILLREPGMLIRSEEAIFDNLNKTSRFTSTEYVLHEQQAHGKAGKVNIDASEKHGFLVLEQASFTVCPPSAELWSFDARRIELDHAKGWGKMYSAKLQVADTPVLYIPYIDFPIDDRRKSGLLWPSISSSNGNGIDITQPYYFNLMPQADLTYIPRYNSDHGLMHGIEARYKNRFSEWTTGGTYLGNDDMVGDVEVKDDPALDRQRWMAFVQEEGRLNANWSSTIDYQAVSDINYFRDWGTTGFDIQKSLNLRRYATLNFANEDWKASGTVIDYQSLELDPLTGKVAEEDYRRLPVININYRNEQKNFFYNPVFNGQYTFFDHEEYLRAHRLHLAPGAMLPMRWKSGEVISTFRLKHNTFSLNDSNSPGAALQPGTVYQDAHSVNVPTLSINNRLFLERDLAIGDQQYMQTLTPRLFYYYADYEDQSNLPNFDTIETAFSYNQLFRDNRFGSYDRIADANQLSWAIESGLINYRNGQKLFSMGIGQIRYFQDRRVTPFNTDAARQPILSTDTLETVRQKTLINQEIDRRYYREASDIALQPTWHIDNDQRLSGSVIWDPYLKQNQEAAIGYHYSDNARRIFNAAYRYKRNPFYNINGQWFTMNSVDQTDLSFYLPINQQWHGYMRWNYDITNNTTIEDIAGVKYEGCCFGVMLAYQRERKTFENNVRIPDATEPGYSSSWFIQFELKGFGGITNTLTHLLEESIEGYLYRESDF